MKKKEVVQEIEHLVSIVSRVEENLKIDGYNLERIKERLEKLKKEIKK